MHDPPLLNERITADLGVLSPKLRRAATYVAEHPDEVATRSLRHLAGVTGLTPTTFSRMATALGFENYEALRETCRLQLKRNQLSFAEKAGVLQSDGTSHAGPRKGLFVVRQGRAAIDNISALINGADPKQLESIAGRLAGARKVLLVGMMSSRPFVEYAEYMASMAFENWSVYSQESGPLAAAPAGMDDTDVALVVSTAPYAGRSIRAAQQASRRGAFVIAITDGVMSPLASASSVALVVNTESPQFFSSHVATLVLIESLVGMAVARGGKASRDRIAAVEQGCREMGEYWSAGN